MLVVFSILLVDLISFEAEAQMSFLKRKMTIEEVHEGIKEGMTREEVEAYFSARNIKYSFNTRAKVDQFFVPKFIWKSPDAIGFYGATIQDNGRKWLGWWFFPEHLSIRVEINSQGKVSQVVAKYGYTGP